MKLSLRWRKSLDVFHHRMEQYNDGGLYLAVHSHKFV